MNEKQRKGCESQLIAETYFVRKGYRIYAPPNSTGGPIDFVAVNDETLDIRLVEVKTKSVRSMACKGRWRGKRINRVLSETQKKLGVQMIYVDLDKKEVEL